MAGRHEHSRGGATSNSLVLTGACQRSAAASPHLRDVAGGKADEEDVRAPAGDLERFPERLAAHEVKDHVDAARRAGLRGRASAQLPARPSHRQCCSRLTHTRGPEGTSVQGPSVSILNPNPPNPRAGRPCWPP